MMAKILPLFRRETMAKTNRPLVPRPSLRLHRVGRSVGRSVGGGGGWGMGAGAGASAGAGREYRAEFVAEL